MITATQGVHVTSDCGACGGVLVRDLGQFVDRGLLRWGVEGRCPTCSDAWCETGTGPAPPEIRQALLAEHGASRLRLATGQAGLVPVLRALRETYDLSLAEARLKAAELSGAGLVGTSVEMAYLAEGLCKRSLTTTLTPAPACFV
ncbi:MULTISPECIES: hypothetical protein [Streptomyces]|uniref:hypothetical protein n=1 Tax=Streptomyces TaxID=1883 RepID=UPI000FFEC750|nr:MULTISPECIES: hypothetical protein [Streptomyces]